MAKQIEVRHGKKLLAIILPADYKKKGVSFFTPNNFSQQLGYMQHPKGYQIPAHVHNLHMRNVIFTLETIFVKKGKVKVDFYTEKKKYVESQVLKTGDVMMLVAGGHGFTMLAKSELIEVKQGPYFGDEDKEVFGGISGQEE